MFQIEKNEFSVGCNGAVHGWTGFFGSGLRLFPTGSGVRFSFLKPEPDWIWILRLLKKLYIYVVCLTYISWKIAHITPIPKVHSPSSSSEYRPISVLPLLSKLFEKVLYHRVYSYLTEHNLIDERQFGFRENHSTELAITTIYDELLRNFDNKLITCSLFLDLSKAFDCCDHEILLDKRHHYGIRGASHKLFSYFLHNRMQCTKIRDLNLHTKGYLAGSLRVVLFRLCFSLFTLRISQKHPLFILLYLLMILISNVCQIPLLMFFRQLPTLNYAKLTTV